MSKTNYFYTIKTAIEEYDNYEYKIINFLKKIEYFKIINPNNLTPRIKFYDSNKNLLLDSGYENIGIYKQKNNIWEWGWSINSINNNQNFISRNILLYSFKLRSEIESEFFLKSILLSSKHKIKNKLQLEILLALSSYLSKFHFIFKLPILPNTVKNENTEEYINYKNLFTDKNINNCNILYLFIIDYNFNLDNQY
jgi:hypothetical protein